MLSQAGFLAQRRLARGIKLNRTEAIALICCVLLEHVRDGIKSLSELSYLGTTLLGTRLVHSSVPFVLSEVQLEATFPDGTKLITVHQPVSSLDGDIAGALYGSFLPIPSLDLFPVQMQDGVEPGIIYSTEV